MLLTILGAILALVLGLVAGGLLAVVLALVVWWAVSVTANGSEPEFSEIFFQRVWIAIPLTAIFTFVLALAGPGSLAGSLGIGICLILTFQIGRAYQDYN